MLSIILLDQEKVIIGLMHRFDALHWLKVLKFHESHVFFVLENVDHFRIEKEKIITIYFQLIISLRHFSYFEKFAACLFVDQIFGDISIFGLFVHSLADVEWKYFMRVCYITHLLQNPRWSW